MEIDIRHHLGIAVYEDIHDMLNIPVHLKDDDTFLKMSDRFTRARVGEKITLI